MHGLIFRTVEAFVNDCYGRDSWMQITARADIGVQGFEAMLPYPAEHLPELLAACAEVLEWPQTSLLEDIGTYLVSHPTTASIRRLMRFGGEDFVELLYSLEDLPGRARLAVVGLELPRIDLKEYTPNHFSISCDGEIRGFSHVLLGLLRAMADDYGTLAILDHSGNSSGQERISIQIIQEDFAHDKGFALVAAQGGASG